MTRDYPPLAVFVFAGIFAPLILPGYVSQISFLWIYILFALTWNLQGGQMGYNSFGNIFFFGVGMYVAAAAQIGLYFDLADWTAAGGERTFIHTPRQYAVGFAVGVAAAAVAAPLCALLLGPLILSMRGHYFAICTLGLGVAAGEIAAGLEIIGAGGGMSVPRWPVDMPDWIGDHALFCYLAFAAALGCLLTMRRLRSSRFGLALNAIRDDEDKAEAMGLATTGHKIAGWCVSAFFLGIAGAIAGHISGFIDPTEVAFAGATFGVYMILMTILGGKGTLWGPVIGALIFHLAKELLWTYLLGWQYVALGALIIVTVVFFPRGLIGLPAAFRAAAGRRREKRHAAA